MLEMCSSEYQSPLLPRAPLNPQSSEPPVLPTRRLREETAVSPRLGTWDNASVLLALLYSLEERERYSGYFTKVL